MSTANRPIAVLDDSVEEAINKGQQVSKKHAGIFNRGIVRLPDKLKEAVDRIITDQTDGQLLEAAKKLNNHIAFKKPPLTAEEIENLKKECQRKVVNDNPVPGMKQQYPVVLHNYSIYLTLFFLLQMPNTWQLKT